LKEAVLEQERRHFISGWCCSSRATGQRAAHRTSANVFTSID